MKNYDIYKNGWQVLFSDETQLFQMKTDCIPKWVSQEEAYRLEYVDQHDRNARINVMFCGYLTYSEVGSKVLILILI